MGASGQATINGGAAGNLTNEVTATVTGQTGILASSSEVEAWVQPKATTHHSVDEHRVDQLKVSAYNIVDNTGFDISVRCENGPIYGDWNIAWVWN
jgi:predicted phage gp36 major capsid-like protein